MSKMPELPNEVRLMIFQKFDLQTALQFIHIGRKSDVELIQKYLKFDVSISVKFYTVGTMEIKLREPKEENGPGMTWRIHKMYRNRSAFNQFDSTGILLYHDMIDNTCFSDSAFGIVRRIFSNPMFRVKRLHMYLTHFRGDINFGKTIDGDNSGLTLILRDERMLQEIKDGFAKPPKIALIDSRKDCSRFVQSNECRGYWGSSKLFFITRGSSPI